MGFLSKAKRGKAQKEQQPQIVAAQEEVTETLAQVVLSNPATPESPGKSSSKNFKRRERRRRHKAASTASSPGSSPASLSPTKSAFTEDSSDEESEVESVARQASSKQVRPVSGKPYAKTSTPSSASSASAASSAATTASSISSVSPVKKSSKGGAAKKELSTVKQESSDESSSSTSSASGIKAKSKRQHAASPRGKVEAGRSPKTSDGNSAPVPPPDRNLAMNRKSFAPPANQRTQQASKLPPVSTHSSTTSSSVSPSSSTGSSSMDSETTGASSATSGASSAKSRGKAPVSPESSVASAWTSNNSPTTSDGSSAMTGTSVSVPTAKPTNRKTFTGKDGGPKNAQPTTSSRPGSAQKNADPKKQTDTPKMNSKLAAESRKQTMRSPGPDEVPLVAAVQGTMQNGSFSSPSYQHSPQMVHPFSPLFSQQQQQQQQQHAYQQMQQYQQQQANGMPYFPNPMMQSQPGMMVPVMTPNGMMMMYAQDPQQQQVAATAMAMAAGYPMMPPPNMYPPAGGSDDLTPFDSVSNGPTPVLNPGQLPTMMNTPPAAMYPGVQFPGGYGAQPMTPQMQPGFFHPQHMLTMLPETEGAPPGPSVGRRNRSQQKELPEWMLAEKVKIGGEGTLMDQVIKGRELPNTQRNLVGVISSDQTARRSKRDSRMQSMGEDQPIGMMMMQPGMIPNGMAGAYGQMPGMYAPNGLPMGFAPGQMMTPPGQQPMPYSSNASDFAPLMQQGGLASNGGGGGGGGNGGQNPNRASMGPTRNR